LSSIAACFVCILVGERLPSTLRQQHQQCMQQHIPAAGPPQHGRR
jgi:hypothetical protein